MGEPELRPHDLPQLRRRRGVPRIRGVEARLQAGTTVDGFRIERPIGGGDTGFVYEATQLSLDRRVALRVIDVSAASDTGWSARLDRDLRLAASLHHPSLVTTYATGDWEGARYVATRLIRGGSLADLRERRAPFDVTALASVADALETAHSAGLLHGRIDAGNILVEHDGTPYLADLGLGRGTTREDDERALAQTIAKLNDPPAPPTARRRASALGAAAMLLAAAVVGFALAGGDDDAADDPQPPASPPGTLAIGSSLSPGAVESRGCSESPTANTSACSLAQRDAVVERDGVVRSWAVRDASGDLALQVIRRRSGQSSAVGFTQPRRVSESAVASFPVEVAVRAGDRIGLRLGPGAQVGLRGDSARKPIELWAGGLTATPQAVDQRIAGAELLLRADVDYGATVQGPRQLTGRAAAALPPGRELGELEVALADGASARVAIVAVSGDIALDVFRGRRLARIFVPDADPEGQFFGFSQGCGPSGAAGFCLRWRNPGTALPLHHEYEVLGNGRIKLIG